MGTEELQETKNTPARESASVSGDRIREEIAQKIFDLFEQYGCSVGAAEQIMDDVKWKIWSTVPVRGGFYEFLGK
ncbi:MAG: hypothetical protein IJO75_06170 [Clostridia bacterium]|nr:hypothetical protein [Clostridia bacterium]